MERYRTSPNWAVTFVRGVGWVSGGNTVQNNAWETR